MVTSVRSFCFVLMVGLITQPVLYAADDRAQAMPAPFHQEPPFPGAVPSFDEMLEEVMPHLYQKQQEGGVEDGTVPGLIEKEQREKFGQLSTKHKLMTLFFGFLHKYFSIVDRDHAYIKFQHADRIEAFRRVLGGAPQRRAGENPEDFARRQQEHDAFIAEADRLRQEIEERQRRTGNFLNADGLDAERAWRMGSQEQFNRIFPERARYLGLKLKRETLLDNSYLRFAGKHLGTLTQLSQMLKMFKETHERLKKERQEMGLPNTSGIEEYGMYGFALSIMGLQLIAHGNDQMYYTQAMIDMYGPLKGTLADSFLFKLAPAALNYYVNKYGENGAETWLPRDQRWVEEYCTAINFAASQLSIHLKDALLKKYGYQKLEQVRSYSLGTLRMEMVDLFRDLVTTYAWLHTPLLVADTLGGNDGRMHLQGGSFSNMPSYAEYKVSHYMIRSMVSHVVARTINSYDHGIIRGVKWLGSKMATVLGWFGIKPETVGIPSEAVHAGYGMLKNSVSYLVPFYIYFFARGHMLFSRPEDLQIIMRYILTDPFNKQIKHDFTHKVFENIIGNIMQYREKNYGYAPTINYEPGVPAPIRVHHGSWVAESPRWCTTFNLLWFMWWFLYADAYQSNQEMSGYQDLAQQLFAAEHEGQGMGGGSFGSPQGDPFQLEAERRKEQAIMEQFAKLIEQSEKEDKA